MRYPGMTVEGALISILYLLFFYLISWIVVKRRYADPRMRRLFFQGLTLKFMGGLAFALIYQFYYAGGDTFRYFANARTLTDFFFTDPWSYLQYMSQLRLDGLQIERLSGITDAMGTSSNYVVVRLASLLGIFTGGHYLLITFGFAFLSYVGIWALYRTTCRLFPTYFRFTAVAILFIPSFFFWGSSLMKESIVVGFLGLLVYLSYRILILKEFRLSFMLLFAWSFYTLINVKVYVILSFLPALILWLIFANARRIRNPRIRLLIKPFSLGILALTIAVGLPIISSYSERYSLDAAMETAEITANYIQRVSERDQGSVYTLDIEYTPLGLLAAAPAAINVTLFRPYLWEVRNPVMLLAALEGSAFLLITLFLLFKVGLFNFFRFIFSHPFLVASLTFSLIFAFAVGASTFNFGALVRYKIPCLPFYGLVLAVAYGEYQARRRQARTNAPHNTQTAGGQIAETSVTSA
jgi:hypothetical protein